MRKPSCNLQAPLGLARTIIYRANVIAIIADVEWNLRPLYNHKIPSKGVDLALDLDVDLVPMMLR